VRNLERRLLFFFFFFFLAVLTSLPGTARAAGDCLGGDVGPGFIVALPNCLYTVHGDVTVTAGTASPAPTEGRAAARLAVEAGVLFATNGRRSLELGPAFAVAAMSDVRNGHFKPELAPILRLRRWFADDFFSFEAGAGPSLRFFSDAAMPGIIADVGVRIKGFGGLEVMYDGAYRPYTEHRVMGGFRFTWGALFVGIACAASRRSC
jgi:hypothetical protein